jgi:hypothetical protein
MIGATPCWGKPSAWLSIYDQASISLHCPDQTRTVSEKEGKTMSGYTISALALDQRAPAARFALAVSIFDSNRLGVPNLRESNFTVYNLMSETRFSITEIQNTTVSGFYRLFLRAEPVMQTGECVLALVVTGSQHVVGRVPESPENGHVLVKVRIY